MKTSLLSSALSRPLTRALRRAGCVAAALAALSPLATQAAIVVDGQAGDWTAVPVLANASAVSQGASALKLSVENGRLYVLAQGQALSGNYNLFLDTDANAATGHQSYLWSNGSGADYLLSNGALYRSTGSGWSWAPMPADLQVAVNGSAVELGIPLASLGLPADGSGLRLAASFQALTADWQTGNVLPAAGALAAYANAVVQPAIGKGLIIPAYLPLSDAANWNLLKEGAAVMAAGRNPAFRDYWVAVNSGHSGPFTAAAEWTQAAAVWNPIRSNGGKIFGYVHTCVEPTGPHLRPLATVKGEIAAWVQGYPQLDGIWLDEYYPRFEIADADGANGPTYPNGVENAPTDRGFVNSLNQFNGQQVVPTGGYYDQLVRWIRSTYPGLRIIGNAGGAFYSNQLHYADLPDVLVSFEQNFDTAANAPVNDWSGLNRQVPNSKSGQLALIHRNTANLAGAVDQALSHGYTHVYTTD